MTSNPDPAPESTKNAQGFKSLIVKGAIAAVSLAGTTAIPILVQKSLSPTSTPTENSSPAVPAQTSPAQITPNQAVPAQIQTGSAEGNTLQMQPMEEERRKGRSKKKKKDDD